MTNLLIIKVGDAFPEVVRDYGDFETLFQQALAAEGFTASVFDPRTGAPLPDPATIDGLIITGSHSMVSEREPWSEALQDRKSTRLNSSHVAISYAVFCLKKKNKV